MQLIPLDDKKKQYPDVGANVVAIDCVGLRHFQELLDFGIAECRKAALLGRVASL